MIIYIKTKAKRNQKSNLLFKVNDLLGGIDPFLPISVRRFAHLARSVLFFFATDSGEGHSRPATLIRRKSWFSFRSPSPFLILRNFYQDRSSPRYCVVGGAVNAFFSAFSLSRFNPVKHILVLIAVFQLGSSGAIGQCTEGGFDAISNPRYNHAWNNDFTGGSSWIGQDFTACATGTLSELRVFVGWPPDIPQTLNLYIYEGPDTSGNLLATVPRSKMNFVRGGGKPGTPSVIDLSSVNPKVSVVAGQQYTFMFDTITDLATNFYTNMLSWNTYVGGSIFSNGARVPAGSINAPDNVDILFEIDIDVATSTWTGSSWNNGTPNRDANAIIASSGSPGDFKAVNLTINNGVTVNLGSGDTALVSGTLTNNGNGFSGSGVIDFYPGGANAKVAEIKGNAFNWGGITHIDTGYSLASSHSLTTNGLLTLSASSAGSYGVLLGNGTVTDNIKAEAYLDLAGGSNDGRYYHLGAPFNNATLSDFNEGQIMVSANTQQGTAWEWDAANASWVPAGSGNTSNDRLASNAVIGKGYALYAGSNTYGTFLRKDPGALTLTGTPINSDVTIALSYNDGQSGGSFAGGTNTAATEGWNFLANPYPAQLDWDVQDDQLPNGLNSTVYTWNGANYTSYVNGASTNTGTRYIAPFQGFFVQLSTNTTPNFAFDADARVVSGQTVELNKTTTANPQLDGINLAVATANGGARDDIYVGFEALATVGYDREWDAQKLLNPEGVPNLSVSLGGELYSICRVPYSGPWSFPLKLDYATDGEAMNITVDQTNLQSFGQVTLEDLKTGSTHDLTLGVYNFTYDKGYGPQRFILHFGKANIGLEETAGELPLFAYATEQGLTVELGTLEDARISVYNLAGQLVASRQASKGPVPIPLEKHGVYLLRVETGKQTETFKIIR